MAVAFKLSLSISSSNFDRGERSDPMSDRAEELAEQVNERKAKESSNGELQLLRYKLLQAKGPAFWKRFKSVAHEEVDSFNKKLRDPEDRITLDDSGAYEMSFRGAHESIGQITCNLTGQAIGVSCDPVPPRKMALSTAFELKVGYDDNIHMKSIDGERVTQADVVLNLLRYMAGL